MANKPDKILVIGFGNPGRLDDGLGPVFAEQLLDELKTHNITGVTVDSNYQLNVEDACEIANHDVVIFVDAALAGSEPFFFTRLMPEAALGFSTHTIEPEAVLALAHTSFKAETMGFALGIRGYEFNEFDEMLSEKALENLDSAMAFLIKALKTRTFKEEGTPPPALMDKFKAN
jgi:hydrogenase maturation protease